MEKFSFADFNLPPKIIKAIEDMGFEEPSPIQALSIPKIMEGNDIIGQSQTGTGKTAAFGIPILSQINAKSKDLQAVILCPTRELAIQISEEFQKIAKHLENVKIIPIYGGQSIDRQIKALKNGIHVIIGTPGRVIDHLERKTLKMNSVKIVVLDEGDEMLDMGFREDIERILNDIPAERQTILFSATMPKQIIELTKKYQNDPILVKVSHKELTVPLTAQHYFELEKNRIKLDVCTRVIDLYNPKLTLIFCNTKKMVDELVAHLQSRGYFADGIHGDMKQTQRNTVMTKFKKEVVDILVATDVAARGIDIDHIEVVINYDLPRDEEYYVHRIGRTGRAGRSGKAFSFAVGKEIRKLKDIEKYTKTKMTRLPIPTVNEVEEYKNRQFIDKVKKTIDDGHLTKFTNMIERLLDEEYTSVDIAAALLKMSLQEKMSEKNTTEHKKELTTTFSDSDMKRLFINIGRKQKVNPKDIVGSIAGETGISGSVIGAIDIYENFTFVDIPENFSDKVISVMNDNFIRGKKITVEFATTMKNKKIS